MKKRDENFIREAFLEAEKAFKLGEVPIGAVLVQNNQIIARNFNQREKTKNPLHHAEILVLEEGAKKIDSWRLTDTTLYVTLEPCPMCLGALLQARVGRLVYGCADPKRSVSKHGHTLSLNPLRHTQDKPPSLEGEGKIDKLSGNNHTVSVFGPVLEEECSGILKKFFKERRKK